MTARRIAIAYKLRRGFGPDWVRRSTEITIDDESNGSIIAIMELALKQFEAERIAGEDFAAYGKNWTVTGCREVHYN